MARRKKKIKVNIPGYTPDYNYLLQNDPSYVQYGANQGVQSAGGKTNRNQGIIQQLVQFGQLPDLTGIDLGDFGIDQATMDAISANTRGGGSKVAQMDKDYATEVQSLQDMLAARGMLRSGSLGTGLRLEQDEYALEQKTAREALLAALQGLQDEFADAESDRDADLLEYGESIGKRIRDANPPRESRTSTATRIGNNLYQDADGNYYDRAGNVVHPEGRKLRRRVVVRRPRPRTPRYGPGGQV